ncbi:hypothetical protein WR25_09802 isoform B [Diploscapter pachys]|uniref:Uncharacterized protein n=1 Tax=Diploscapter pachys TaxID=2018661 RepID=A0A2A2KGF1_9BILA|nr:hypothetical protein WR25_09802 isoform B [Diploscapter pachys]
MATSSLYRIDLALSLHEFSALFTVMDSYGIRPMKMKSLSFGYSKQANFEGDLLVRNLYRFDFFLDDEKYSRLFDHFAAANIHPVLLESLVDQSVDSDYVPSPSSIGNQPSFGFNIQEKSSKNIHQQSQMRQNAEQGVSNFGSSRPCSFASSEDSQSTAQPVSSSQHSSTLSEGGVRGEVNPFSAASSVNKFYGFKPSSSGSRFSAVLPNQPVIPELGTNQVDAAIKSGSFVNPGQGSEEELSNKFGSSVRLKDQPMNRLHQTEQITVQKQSEGIQIQDTENQEADVDKKNLSIVHVNIDMRTEEEKTWEEALYARGGSIHIINGLRLICDPDDFRNRERDLEKYPWLDMETFHKRYPQYTQYVPRKDRRRGTSRGESRGDDRGGARYGMDRGRQTGAGGCILVMWSMEITEQSLGSIRVAKQFDLEQDAVNSIDFSRDGMHMLLSTDNDAFHLYDLEWGQRMKVSYSLKYGCRNIRFTNNDSYLVHSSTKVDEWIRHMNISTNTYVHYYQGHTAKVTGLSMNPVSDMFLSTSKDRTLRLWDVRSKYTQGVMQLKSVPTATFDPEGLIFAVTVGSDSVKLYDIRSFDKVS